MLSIKYQEVSLRQFNDSGIQHKFPKMLHAFCIPENALPWINCFSLKVSQTWMEWWLNNITLKSDSWNLIPVQASNVISFYRFLWRTCGLVMFMLWSASFLQSTTPSISCSILKCLITVHAYMIHWCSLKAFSTPPFGLLFGHLNWIQHPYRGTCIKLSAPCSFYWIPEPDLFFFLSDPSWLIS